MKGITQISPQGSIIAKVEILSSAFIYFHGFEYVHFWYPILYRAFLGGPHDMKNLMYVAISILSCIIHPESILLGSLIS